MICKRFALPNATSGTVAVLGFPTKGVLFVETDADVFVGFVTPITSANAVRVTDDIMLPLEIPKGVETLYTLATGDESSRKGNLVMH